MFTCTVLNEFGVISEIESYTVQRPASVTEKLYVPDAKFEKIADWSNVISTCPVDALKKYGAVPPETINSTDPSF